MCVIAESIISICLLQIAIHLRNNKTVYIKSVHLEAQ